MTFRTLTLAALVASVAVAAGCTKGSSSRGGGTAAASTGNINSGLPTPNRAAAYNTQTIFAPQGSVAGAKISAMAVATLGTATGVLGSEAPFSNIYAVSSSSNTFEAKLFFDANFIARVDSGATTDYYASTASREAPGAGDVWQRVNNNWQLVYDTADNEAVVATVNSGVWSGFYVAHGSIDGSTTVVRQNGAGFSTIATIQSARPTAMGEYRGDLWVGASDSTATGGGAKLYRYTSGGTFDEVLMPVPLVGQGVYQHVTGMLEIAAPASGTMATPILVVSVGEFGDQGQPISGSVLISNGVEFEVIANYQGEAPTAVAFIDDTIYVGTTGGKLQYRDDNGEMQDETTLPTNTGVHALAVSGNELFIGASISTGPAIFVRKGGAAPGPGPTPTDLYFADVQPLLAANCASCHGGALPAAEAAWPLTSPTSTRADYDEIINNNRVDTTTPANSQLLLKALADTSVGGHTGGVIAAWAIGTPAHTTVTAWITQGARFDAGGGTPTPKTFTANIAPILSAASDCGGCHGTSGGLSVSNYAQVVARVNSGTPEASLLLTKPNDPTHGGGVIAGYAPGSAKHNEIIQWIQDGTQQ